MSGVLIVLIVFTFTAFIVKMGLDHEREKRSFRPSNSNNSLTTSELKQLIRDAVDDANVDLQRRLDTLERQLERGTQRPELPERFADRDRRTDLPDN